jgi:hypothetical protein
MTQGYGVTMAGATIAAFSLLAISPDWRQSEPKKITVQGGVERPLLVSQIHDCRRNVRPVAYITAHLAGRTGHQNASGGCCGPLTGTVTGSKFPIVITATVKGSQRAAAGVTEPDGGVVQVEPGGKELAGGVVPHCLDVELDSGCGADRVDRQVSVLMGLGVLADLLAALDYVVVRHVHDAVGQVNAADLHGAQLAAAHAGDGDKPHVECYCVLPAGAGLLDHLHDHGRRDGWLLLLPHGGRFGGLGRVEVDPLPAMRSLERPRQDAVNGVDGARGHRLAGVR